MIAALFAHRADDEAMMRSDRSITVGLDGAHVRNHSAVCPACESIIGLIVAILLIEET